MKKEKYLAPNFIQIFFKSVTVSIILFLPFLLYTALKDLNFKLLLAVIPIVYGLRIIGSIGFTGYLPKEFYKHAT